MRSTRHHARLDDSDQQWVIAGAGVLVKRRGTAVNLREKA